MAPSSPEEDEKNHEQEGWTEFDSGTRHIQYATAKPTGLAMTAMGTVSHLPSDGRKWIVVAVIILSCGGIVWLPFMGADVKPWEQGKDVPETPPAEDRRVYHPNYFSIVAPLNWECSTTLPEPGSTILRFPEMTLWPKRSFGGRCAGIHVVGPFDMSSDLSGFDYRETIFQGQPAFFHVETRPSTFDDPPQFCYRLFFERSGDGYELTYVGLLHQEELPPMVQRYLDTFRVEAPIRKEEELQTSPADEESSAF